MSDGFKPRNSTRRAIVADQALIKRHCSPFAELDGHRAATKKIIAVESRWSETKRERERRENRERKLRTGVIR